MKKQILLTLIVLAFFVCPVFGQKAGVTYSEQYRLFGFRLYGNNYIHTGVKAGVEGLDFEAVNHFLDEDSDLKIWDAKVSKKIPIGNVSLSPGYGYYMVPGMDIQAVSMIVAIENKLFSPRYSVTHIEPEFADKDGQIHALGFDAAIGKPEEILALLSAEAVYNDGVNLLGGQRPHDITHLSAALTLKLPISERIVLLPGVAYQHSFEPEILMCDRNECWATVDLEYRF